MNQPSAKHPSRRDFLKTSGAVAGATVAGSLAIGRGAHAAGSDMLRIGLIGCGGRGTGAAGNAMDADANCKLVAMGDAFGDRLETSLKSLQKKYADRVDVPKDRCFTGFDAYQKVIDAGVDVVILAEVPHFRPQHLKAAVAAGKHIFCEKPVAVDGPGIRSILETSEEAKKKNLNLVSGLCWRYHTGVQETMKRVLGGEIGDIVAIQETYLAGSLWHRGHQPEWTEMEYQMRNWYYFTWLSGDHNVEQHIHSLDKAMWTMHDEPPEFAWGLGGRQVRTDNKYGDIYDHHAVLYQWGNGVPCYAYTRQQPGCFGETNDVILGTKGRASVLKFRIEGAKPWEFKGPKCNMYVAEHEALFKAIRSGKPINNGVYMARSTMLAILGRMVNYTGKKITWEEALNSKELLAPKSYDWKAAPPTLPDATGKYPVAIPGVTKFV
jgi:predicted dehydrogenase